MKFFHKMADIKKIAGKIFFFILDTLLFSYSVSKQVILPARRKKGNLLYSLFILFVGIVERVDNFEYGVFQMANLLRRKYVKQSLLIAASLLFLLSSLEWSGEASANTNPGNYITRISEAPVKNIVSSNYAHAPICSTTTFSNRQYLPYKITAHNSFPFTAPVKTFLLFRSILV